MGMDQSTKIGPYLEVKGIKVKETPKVRRICPNHPKKETTDKFCSQCGTPIQSVDYTETKKLNPSQAFRYSDLDDGNGLWSPEGFDDIFINNKEEPKSIHIDSNGDVVDLSNAAELVELQITWFKKTYKEEIEFFNKEFGQDNVSVKWGVVSYWS